MRRWGAVVLLAWCLVTGVPVAHAAEPVTGSLGIRLVDAPTDARDDPRAAVAVVDDLIPGTVVERRIEVSNGTAEPMDVRLYSTGADIRDGIFVGHDTAAGNELSSWVSIDREVLSLPAAATALPVVRIAVPADAAPGERYGVVWAETSTGVSASGIEQLSRVGVRLYLSVSGGNPAPTDFTVTDMVASRAPDGTPSVTARVANTGGRAIDANGTLSLTDGPGGTSAGPVPAAGIRTVAPGQSGSLTFTLGSGLPAGPWTAVVAVTSGVDSSSATATLTFPASGAAAAVTADAGGPSWTDVVVPVGTGILLAVLVVGLVLSRRRRKPAPV